MRDVGCVIHCHSRHSDGTGSVGQIARAARRAGAEVVLLTDHDTLAARERGEDGVREGVLVICGHEVTSARGHLLAFGLKSVVDHRGMDGRAIAAAVRDRGGLGIAAHPWSAGNARIKRKSRGMPFDGIEAADAVELWSAVTDSVEQVRSIREVARFILVPDHWLDHPPPGRIAAYDALLAGGRQVVAIGGLDAHQIGLRVRGRVPLRLMSYRRCFRLLRTRVLLADDAPTSEAAILEALGAGRCYLARDSLAPARGFAFEALDAEGAVLGTLGDELGADAVAELRVRLPRPTAVSLSHDGREHAAAHGTELRIATAGSGAYRAEARLRRHGRERTWILSNPIYLR